MNTVLFNSMELSPEVLKAISDMNYTEMTEIQSRAIPLIMEGKDVIGRSSTGTGKTAAFGIPAVEMVKKSAARKPQVLVLSPTRELAMQISGEVRKYAKYTQNVGIATVYGGQSMEIQIRQLKSANIIIGTPGRIMDHMRRRTLKLDELKMVILDEADEMLNMGFYEDIQTILQEVPEERQTVLFSATMPPAIMKITQEFQNNPEMVAVDKGQRTITTITQYYYQVPQARKMDALNLLIQMNNPARSVIFCNTKKMVDELSEYLNDHGFKSLGLHGDMRQAARTRVMEDFKMGKIRILVATDVAARGIDVEDIEAVFNYDIPQEFEYYIHRIGRTGRAGKTGFSYTLACNRNQVRKVKEIQDFIGAPIVEQAIPSSDDIVKKSMDKFTGKVKKALENKDDNMQWQTFVDELQGEGHDLNQIACALWGMLSSKDKKTVPVVKGIAPMPPMAEVTRGKKPEGKVSRSGRTFLSVDIGRDQKIAPNFIVGAIVDATGLPAKAVGKIDIFHDNTFIEMSEEDARIVLENAKEMTIKNCKVHFSMVGGPKPAFGGEKKKPFFRDGKPGKKPYARGTGKDFAKKRVSR